MIECSSLKIWGYSVCPSHARTKFQTEKVLFSQKEEGGSSHFQKNSNSFVLMADGRVIYFVILNFDTVSLEKISKISHQSFPSQS